METRRKNSNTIEGKECKFKGELLVARNVEPKDTDCARIQPSTGPQLLRDLPLGTITDQSRSFFCGFLAGV